MTDLFRGYDLTTVVDRTAERAWTRMYEEAVAKGFDKGISAWDSLDLVQKRNYKETLLPIVTDVLEALESDKVLPTEAKQMVPYAYIKSDRDDPRWYENQHPLQHDTSTATVWCLHVEAGPKIVQPILERMSVLPETTGEYLFDGDKWVEWGTPIEDRSGGPAGLDEQHLAIYFHATPATAQEVGLRLAEYATQAAIAVLDPYERLAMPLPHAISTSGDWAEQVPTP